VIKAISAGAEGNNIIYGIGSKVTFKRRFLTLFNTNIASAALILPSLFLFTVILFISLLFIVFLILKYSYPS
jgi:hypothetical protein